MAALLAYAIDVGSTRPSKASPRGAFAWARARQHADGLDVVAGTRLGSMLTAMHEDARTDALVTLGIEAPPWLPVPADETRLSSGRVGDGSRSCFAPAGGYVATLGLHQLAHVARRVPHEWTLTVDWRAWNRANQREVLVWEAFVSANAHARGDDGAAHMRDAATAAVEFLKRADDLHSDVVVFKYLP